MTPSDSIIKVSVHAQDPNSTARAVGDGMWSTEEGARKNAGEGREGDRGGEKRG